MDIGGLIQTGIKTALNLVTGGLSGKIMGVVDDLLGDGVPPDKKAELRLGIEREITARTIAANEAARDAETAVTQRAALLEGTASDLKALPLVGPLVLFLRGAQRPVWGFATLYMDMMIYSQEWAVSPDSYAEVSLVVINVLVLGFLFGERAVKNLMPIIMAWLDKRRG